MFVRLSFFRFLFPFLAFWLARFLSFSLFLFLSVSICLSVCLSVYLFVYLSIYLSVDAKTSLGHLSIYVSIYLSISNRLGHLCKIVAKTNQNEQIALDIYAKSLPKPTKISKWLGTSMQKSWPRPAQMGIRIPCEYHAKSIQLTYETQENYTSTTRMPYERYTETKTKPSEKP